MKTTGSFIVIEGTDGSGKGTQVDLLVKRLTAAGHDVAYFDFPQYDQHSSYFVKEYLNGKYGSADEVGPYTGSLFFALDRYEASFKIKQALDAGKVVIANRYTGSNMGHQGTKFENAEERRGYFIWLDNLEFKMLGIPRPDMSFVLRVPADIAQNLVDNKGQRNYTDKKRDIHEADINHLTRSVQVYDDLCNLFPKDFKRIDCVRNNQLLSIDTVAELVWNQVQPILPKPGKTGTSHTEVIEQVPLLENVDGRMTATAEGNAYLQNILTDATSNVYAFTDKADPMMVAAAMARLSRRGDDMRITLLDEFASAAGKDASLLRRVITAYGDDSVQQLVGIHMVVENASNLLTKKLEWGRLAAYLEQSTRYIYYDTKDANGKYRYYTPDTLNAATKSQYVRTMDTIFDLYSRLVHQLTDYVRSNSNVPQEERDMAWNGATRAQACDAARAVLPVATTSTVGLYASGQAIENMIMNLQADELPEARTVGGQLLEQARKVIPTFLERADKPDRGGATIAYRATTKGAVAELAEEMLPQTLEAATEAVQLISYWPRNELELVADILYEHSNLSHDQIKLQLENVNYADKEKVMKTFIGERLNRRQKPGRAFEKAHYSWDLVCDYGIFRDLQRHRIVDDLAWQQLTPRYGYDIPTLVEEAGLSDLFEECYDLSLSLFSLLQANGYTLEAQYATLLGHKMRWKITYNAREAYHFHELRTSPQGHPGYRKLVKEMHEKVAEVHPIIADGMRFVNKGEDEELTRLAAERYTQFKLQQIEKTE